MTRHPPLPPPPHEAGAAGPPPDRPGAPVAPSMASGQASAGMGASASSPMRATTGTDTGSLGELHRLAAHLQRAREAERSRVARQLHDELGGLFTAAKLDATRIRMKLGQLDPDVAERMSHLIELLNMGVKFKRRLIEDLTPSSLNHLGLIAALELLIDEQGAAPLPPADRAAGSAGVADTPAPPPLAVDHALAPVELSPPLALTAYRACEQALSNVHRHARATQVRVDLRRDGDYALLQVADDGQGFDPDRVPADAYGLLELRYRVMADAGRLQIRSRAGQGTTLSVWLPLSGFSAGPG